MRIECVFLVCATTCSACGSGAGTASGPLTGGNEVLDPTPQLTTNTVCDGGSTESVAGRASLLDDDPCSAVTTGCPATPTAGEQALMTFSYCVYNGPDTSCEPGLLLTCTSGFGPVFWGTIDDYRNTADHPCPIDGNADIGLSGWVDDLGQIHVSYGAQERRPENNCEFTGPALEGEVVFPGGCCSSTLQIHFPTADYGIVYRVQSDWQTP